MVDFPNLTSYIYSTSKPVFSHLRAKRGCAKINRFKECLIKPNKKTNAQAPYTQIQEISLSRILQSIFALPGKLSDTVYNALIECKDITYDNMDLKLIKDYYGDKNIFDLGLRFAIIANNTLKKRGNAYFINQIPEIFSDISQKQLCKSLDILNLLLRPDKINKFSIGEKTFTAKLIAQGSNNDVYLIENSEGKKVCYRQARTPFLLTGYGHDIYTEAAVNLEAQKAGVKDITKLYMTNPVFKLVSSKKDKLGYKVAGAWQIVEYADKNKINSNFGISLEQWLESKGLVHSDLCDSVLENESNIIGSKIVDLGGIRNTESCMTQKHGIMNWAINEYQRGTSSKGIIQNCKKHLN